MILSLDNFFALVKQIEVNKKFYKYCKNHPGTGINLFQVVVEKKKSKKKKKVLAPLAPDGPPQALDLAAHLKLLGDSITKMGEITGEVRK